MSAFTLKKLVGRSLTERDLLYEVLGEIKTSLDRGIVNYGKNIVKYRKVGVITSFLNYLDFFHHRRESLRRSDQEFFQIIREVGRSGVSSTRERQTILPEGEL